MRHVLPRHFFFFFGFRIFFCQNYSGNYRILFKLSIIGYKVVNNTAPIYLSNSFKLYQPTTTQNLRIGSGREMLMLVYKNSVHNQLNNNLSKLTQTWNSLPYEIRSISAYAVFKKISKHIISEKHIL